jgi:hypothetical protein
MIFGKTRVSDLPDVRQVGITTDYDKANDEFVIDYSFAPDVYISLIDTGIVAIGPEGFGKPLPVGKLSEAVFRVLNGRALQSRARFYLRSGWPSSCPEAPVMASTRRFGRFSISHRMEPRLSS